MNLIIICKRNLSGGPTATAKDPRSGMLSKRPLVSQTPKESSTRKSSCKATSCPVTTPTTELQPVILWASPPRSVKIATHNSEARPPSLLPKLNGGPKETAKAPRSGTPGKKLPVLAPTKMISRRRLPFKDSSFHRSTELMVNQQTTPWACPLCREVSE